MQRYFDASFDRKFGLQAEEGESRLYSENYVEFNLLNNASHTPETSPHTSHT